MEFEFRADGKLRYANNSNYKKDSMIRKEGKETVEKGELPYFAVCFFFFLSVFCFSLVRVSQSVIEEVKRIIKESEITK